MESQKYLCSKVKTAGIALALLLLLVPGICSFAQNSKDFSGVWTQDKERSDDFYKSFNITITITQNSVSFTVITVFSDDSGKEMVSRQSTFSLEGKETTGENGSKLSASWSGERKILTTTDVKDYGGDLVGNTTSYSLSDDGKSLSVVTSDIKPGVRTVEQVFIRKK